MSLEIALFDLDDTLYPRNTPIMDLIGERIKTFMINTLGLTYEEASKRRDYYNYIYGTVLRGLLQEDAIDIQAYLDFVHDIPVADILQPNPQLGDMLVALSLQKYIFTNSYRGHALNVMNALGVRDHFEDIFDIQTVNYVSKPARHSYNTVVHLLDVEPQVCVYIDDKSRNLKEPKLMGMKTILVDAEPNEWVDIMVENVIDVGRAIESLVS